MKKYRLSVFVLIIISLLIFGACDAKGCLNDRETAGLYDEVSCSTNRLVHISKYFCLKKPICAVSAIHYSLQYR